MSYNKNIFLIFQKLIDQVSIDIFTDKPLL